jgi:predicted ABC-type ATPase
MIAGPNGAGKTTFALQYLPKVARCTRFINADLIAAGLSPLAPERALFAASRLYLQSIEQQIAERTDFAFETTLAGRSYLRLVKRLRSSGWRVEMLYLALSNVDVSKKRVAERVKHGGHDVREVDLERRFGRSLRHLLNDFSHQVDRCACLMNEGEQPEMVFEQHRHKRSILNESRYQVLLQEAQR